MRNITKTIDIINPYVKWLYVCALLLALIPSYNSTTQIVALSILAINTVVQIFLVWQNKEFVKMVEIKEKIVQENLKLFTLIGMISAIINVVYASKSIFYGPVTDYLKYSIFEIYEIALITIALFIITTLLIDIIDLKIQKIYQNRLIIVDVTVLLVITTLILNEVHTVLSVLSGLIMTFLIAYCVYYFYQRREKLLSKFSSEKIYLMIGFTLFVLFINQILFTIDNELSNFQSFHFMSGKLFIFNTFVNCVMYLLIVRILDYILTYVITFNKISVNGKVIYPLSTLCYFYTMLISMEISLTSDGTIGLAYIGVTFMFGILLTIISLKKYPITRFKGR